MNLARIGTVARYTVLEAWRNRMLLLVLAATVLLLLASVFARSLAIADSARLQAAVLAAMLRLAAVFFIGLYVLSGLTREFNDKVVELMLSLDLPRPAYLLGKFCGFALLAVAVAALCGFAIALVAPPATALAWGSSLALELLIVTSLAVFCVTTFTQLLTAAAFVGAFYLLARSITAIQLMSGSSLAAVGLGHDAARWLADALAFLLPRLDGFTQTGWLLEGVSLPSLGLALGQTAIYVPLLLAAAMFDLYRRNF